jgi:rubrerythrin
MLKAIGLLIVAWTNQIICRLKKRHTVEFMMKQRTPFHQFYRNGGGRMAMCPHCGFKVIFRNQPKPKYLD